MALLFISIFLQSLFRLKKTSYDKLVQKARTQENNGQYDEALAHYNTALIEVKKTKNHATLKASIIDKIKTLHTVIKYQKNFSTALPLPILAIPARN